MRPKKIRMIRNKPAWRRYSPEGTQIFADMAINLDMLEALRLVDAEGYSRKQASHDMGISTPTLCRILKEARRRVAVALRDELSLTCEAGNVLLCPPSDESPDSRKCADEN